MAMLTRRPRTTLPSAAGLDPFRVMREFMRMEPGGDDLEEIGGEFVPSFEMKETPDAFVLRGDVPGVRDEDLDISISGQTLTVSGKREEEAKDESERYYRYERSYGTFARSFALPDTADLENASANLEGGVLSVTMPKRESAKARKIEISKTASA